MLKSGFQKRLGILSLTVVFMLCVAMVLHSPHVGTLLNTRVVSSSFGDVIQNTSQKDAKAKDTRADDIKLPTQWWSESGEVASDFDGGSGTVEDPYRIATPAQLALMADKINNQGGAYLRASYQLVADVDMSAYFWSPMGTWAGDRAFSGTFDGGTHHIDADGVDRGTVHTINGLIMKNKESVDNGSTVGFFGLLGDQAVITNVIIDNSISYLDYNLDLDSDSERVTLAIVAAQVRNDATVLFQNMAVLNSTTFAPQTLSEDGQDGVDFIHVEVKSGVYVGWQQGVNEHGGSAKGVIYMKDAHARMSSVMINIYLDLSGWDMSPDVVINSFGGFIGEARQVDIRDSSYEGVVGIEVVRKDRNMDNAQFIYNAGGLIGTMDAYDSSTSFFENIDLSGSIYLDTFKNEDDGFNRNLYSAQSSKSSRSEASAQSSKEAKDIPWSADVRQIGNIIGDANMWGKGNLEISDVTASFFIDAPKGNNVNLGDKTDQQSIMLGDTQIKSISSVSDLDVAKASINANGFSPAQQQALDQAAQKGKVYAEQHRSLTSQHASVSHTDDFSKNMSSRDLEGPPTAPAGPIVFSTAGPALVFMMSYLAYLGLGMAYGYVLIGLFTTVGLLIVAVIIIIAIVVFAVLFAFWGAQKPKWESVVSVGSAIGSEGRSGITLKNVHTASTAIASDTMFSKNDSQATISESHQTTPTMGMLKTQPESPDVQHIGDKVHLEVTGSGTIMSDGKPGVDSVLEYQWYYNTIDSNNILDGSEPNMGGVVTQKVEGATDPSLDLDVTWSGSRYYFVKQVNHVIEFRGNVNSVTARVGNKKVSLKPAQITQQPEDISINVGTADQTLSVVAEATGDLDYQWYFNTTDSVDGAILLSGGNKSEFVPFQQKSGTYYYFVVVTVSIEISGADETMRADTVSDFAKVDALAIANDIKIAVQPDAKRTVEKNMNTTIGVVMDLSTVNGSLSYQWFKADSITADGVALDGETYQSLAVDTSISNTTSYYYVIVYNTVEDSTTSVRSTTSEITVSYDQALIINMLEPEGGTAIVGEGVIKLSVFATAEPGGRLEYQWFKSHTSGNGEGDMVQYGNLPTINVASSSASRDYYYVELRTVKSNGTKSAIQKSKAVLVEFKDPDQYKFDMTRETLQNTFITSPQSLTGDIIDFSSQDENHIDLQVSMSDIDIVGTINYQWYVSDKADGTDAIAIKGAVGSTWRVENNTATGTKYYFVKIINTANIYNATLSKKSGTSVYTTILNDTDLSPVAIKHSDEKPSYTLLIVLATSTATVLTVVAGAIIFFKNKKQKEYEFWGYSQYRM